MDKIHEKKISIIIMFTAIMLMLMFTILSEQDDDGFFEMDFEEIQQIQTVVILFENKFNYSDSMGAFFLMLLVGACLFLFTKR